MSEKFSKRKHSFTHKVITKEKNKLKRIPAIVASGAIAATNCENVV